MTQTLATLQAVRIAMAKRKTDTKDDASITALLPAIDAVIKQYTKRDLLQTTYTEYHSGRNRLRLVLRQRPIATPSDVTGVYVDQGGYFGQGPNPFPSNSVQVQGRDYAVVLDESGKSQSGMLVRLRSPFVSYGQTGTLWGGPAQLSWPNGIGNVKVQYKAGYFPIPEDLVEAAGLLGAWMIRTGPLGTGVNVLTSENLGAYSYSLGHPGPDDPPELGSSRQILSRYREVAI